jgi:polyhydroxyalkanoate synthase
VPAVRAVTLLNSQLDFTEPGPLGVFVDELSIERLEQRMAGRGFLEGGAMATTFTWLRANDLVWSYVASSWLMGEPPPAFDILAWNADSTRMPAKMHSEYLRWCYLENRLASGGLELAGTPIRLGDVTAEVFAVGAEEDHIAPWRSAYQVTQLLGGPVRFVLTSSGHIAGIVNPPGPKRSYWTRDDNPADPAEWREGATARPGSWWEEWAGWIGERAGERGAAPGLGSAKHPPLADAPGTYVLEQ